MKDWKETANSIGGELTRIVDNYSWWVEKNGQSYNVKVNIYIHEFPNGKFVGVTDRKVKTPDKATPYLHLPMPNKDTPVEALEAVIAGFKDQVGTPDETTFPFIEEV